MIKSFLKSTVLESPLDRMIKYVVNILSEKNNEKIRATIPGFDSPQRAIRKSTGETYIPEVTTVKNKQFRIFAVETKETLGQGEPERRWKLFAEFAKQNSALFYIVFPTGQVAIVKNKLEEFNIEANLWQAPQA
ncbi:MAG TPA: hypothetical protein HPQ03_01915 [Deltaproteobacteria bacterium]|nr:hypothetical protein [Deltaproteobacteria bacterium]